MEVDFQGIELQTPLGGASIGRGYSRVAGTDYFRGLAIDLPIGRLRIGWRAWKEIEEEDEAAETREREASRTALLVLIRHFVFFIVVLSTITVFDKFVDPGDFFVGWVAAIWGAVLLLHAVQFAFSCAERRLRRLLGLPTS